MKMIDVLLSLPAGTRLSMTEGFGRFMGTRMVYGSKVDAVAVVGQADLGGKSARVNGRYVEVWDRDWGFFWRAFEIVR